MNGSFYSRLSPVRRRQQWVFVSRMIAQGLLASSIVGLALGLARLLAGWPITPWIAAAVLAAGPVAGALVGIVRQRSWMAAATAVDAHYRLKDRAATALAFLGRPVQSALYELQVVDAVRHLATVEPRDVVPLRLPKPLPYAVATTVLALGMLIWPSGQQSVEARPSEPLPGILEEAKQIEETLEKFQEIARQEQNKELERLVIELQGKVEEMKQPGVDVREALAKLSEMQASIQAQQAQYNVQQVDAQLQTLGEAMSVAKSLENAGKALAEGEFDKAAKALEQLDAPELDRKEAKEVADKMKKASKQMSDAGMGALGDAASEMAEGIKGDGAKCKAGARSLANEVRKHNRRKKINDLLTNCTSCLSECKSNCQKNSLATGKKLEKSKNPSTTFGMGTSGNPLGDKTDLRGQRNKEQITGQAGDGPSDVETTHSVEGKEQASRAYRDVYQKYHRMSESVLDSEPIPLGHRQTIRRYFELIRPQAADGEKSPAAATSRDPR